MINYLLRNTLQQDVYINCLMKLFMVILINDELGKPYEGKPQVLFDEEGLGSVQPFTLLSLNGLIITAEI